MGDFSLLAILFPSFVRGGRFRQQPLSAGRQVALGRATALPWLRPGIPLMKSISRVGGFRAFVSFRHSPVHTASAPPLPPVGAPRSAFRSGEPASPWAAGSAGRQSCRPPGLGDSPTPWRKIQNLYRSAPSCQKGLTSYARFSMIAFELF